MCHKTKTFIIINNLVYPNDFSVLDINTQWFRDSKFFLTGSEFKVAPQRKGTKKFEINERDSKLYNKKLE